MIQEQKSNADHENNANEYKSVCETFKLRDLVEHLLSRVILRTHCQLYLLKLEHHSHREYIDHHVQDAVDKHVARYEVFFVS